MDKKDFGNLVESVSDIIHNITIHHDDDNNTIERYSAYGSKGLASS